MGSFVFKWTHPANEVYVTGTFDDWAKSVKLDKTGGGHEKRVELSEIEEKILYKFVVDGNWTTDHTAPQEDDGHNNVNNVLLPENITKPKTPKTGGSSEAGIMSGITPSSTTAGLAGQVPKETRSKEPTSATVSSAAPESTTAGLAGNVPKEIHSREPTSANISSATPESTTAGLAGNVPKETHSREPASADISSAAPESTTAGLAGNVPKETHSREPTSANISSAAPDSTTAQLAKDAPIEGRQNPSSSAMPGVFPETPSTEPSEFSVNPIPATSGPGNPVHLAPGEKVPDPSKLTSNTTQSTVHDDVSLARSTDDAQQTFGVAPLPATEGSGNPIHLKAGEKVPRPDEFTSNTTHSHVTTDKESYENSGAILSGAPQLPREDSQQTFGVAPLPATSGPGNPISLKPGEKVPDPSTFTANTIGSSATTDKASYENSGATLSGAPQLPREDSQQTFGVAPLPATSGPGNPISLRPGEKVPDPSSFTANTIGSSVTTDKASYEKGSATSGPPQLPNVVTPQKERDQLGGGMFGLPPVSKSMIPESSLPMGAGAASEPDPGFTIQSAGPSTTTAELAGQVPLEPRDRTKGVPQVVKESQEKAHVGPEASGSPQVVKEKSAMEKELKREIEPEPVTSDDATLPKGGQSEPKTAASGVPDIVQDSQHLAHTDPEASSSPVAVQDKSAMEDELQSKVAPEPSVAEGTSNEVGGTTDKDESSLGGGENLGIAAGGAAVGGVAATGLGGIDQPSSFGHTREMGSGYLPASIQQSINEINSSYKGTSTSSGVPDVVQESISTSQQSPEAASNKEAVAEKRVLEKELLSTLKPAPVSSESAPSIGATTAIGASSRPSDGVPEVVQGSITQSHQSPEAAANSEAVAEKQAMEDELLRKLPSEESAGEPAPAIGSALAASAPAPTTSTTASAAPIDTNVSSIAAQDATQDPPITSATITSPSADGLAAPASVPAMTPSTKKIEQQEVAGDSRDVSPMSKRVVTDPQTQPTVTTGVGESTTESVSKPNPIKETVQQDVSTPAAKATPPAKTTPVGTGGTSSSAAVPRQSSPVSARTSESTASDKKAKRRSFFGKLKDKLR